MCDNSKKLNLFIHNTKEYILRFISKLSQKNDGIYVLNEKWDNLIILDNCRFDVFREEYIRRKLPGKLEYRISRGTWTGEFLIENFLKDRKYYNDIIYITANPFVDKYLKGKFYRIISVWKYGWDSRYNTVLPNKVCEYTLKIIKKYPNKRLIIHFLQPHQPYLSLRRKNFKDNTMEMIKDAISKNKHIDLDFPEEPLGILYLSSIYAYFELPQLLKAYIENLRIVLPYVEFLLHKLQGRTIVTSDHGESFGSISSRILPIKLYGHGISRIPDLVIVPWLIFDKEDKLYLRDPKEIKKEIIRIEKMLGIYKQEESEKLRKVIKNLKLKRKI